MTVKMTGAAQMIAALNKQLKMPETLIRKKVKELIHYAHYNITERTPVWSGQSLRNWVWSMDQASTTTLEAIDNGPPGPTNSMPLGSEPRRPPNQASSDATFMALSYNNPFRNYILTNNAPDIIKLEYGQLPTAASSRSPAGMVRITVQELLEKLKTGR